MVAQNDDSNGIPPKVLTIIMLMVTAVWATSAVAEIVSDYEPTSGINEIMMILAGFLFAGRLAAGKKSNQEDDQ